MNSQQIAALIEKHGHEEMFHDLEQIPSVVTFLQRQVPISFRIELTSILARFTAMHEENDLQDFSGLWSDYRAAINHFSIKGYSLLALAIGNHQNKLVKSLISLTDNFESIKEKMFKIAIEACSSECCDLLFNAGAELTPNPLTATCPFFMAVRQRNVDLTQWMLDKDVDANCRDNEGNTALHYTQDPGVMALLLQKGADPHVLNNEGLTALEILERRISARYQTDEEAAPYFYKAVQTFHRHLTWHGYVWRPVPERNYLREDQLAAKDVLLNAMDIVNVVDVPNPPARQSRFSRLFCCIPEAPYTEIPEATPRVTRR
jgi:hypothetical protein